MAIENLSSYTKVDPNGRFAVSASKNIFTGLLRNEAAYLYKDFGTAYFNASFIHEFELFYDSYDVGSYSGTWQLANYVGDLSGFSSSYTLFVGVASGDFILEERKNGSRVNYDNWTATADTLYYLRVKYNSAVGTYGTIYWYIYSDSGRTNLLYSSNWTLSEAVSFRYLYATASYNSGGTAQNTGYIQNLYLNPPLTYTMVVSVGQFVLTGIDIIIEKTRKLIVEVGQFTLTGIDVGLTKALKMIVGTEAFTLTGIDVGLTKALKLITEVGSFVLTGINIELIKALKIIVSVGQFTLTGIDVGLVKALKVITEVGQFILIGINVTLKKYGWTNSSKHDSTTTNLSKNNSNITNLSKNNSTVINLS